MAATALPKARSLPCLQQVWPILQDGSQDGDSTKKVVDIIAIHGLDTQADRTWLAYGTEGDFASREVHWLRDADMLPSKIRNARIFTYDWKAETILDAAQENLKAHANSFLSKLFEELRHDQEYNPIIFVASCYGGLLVAQALDLADLNSSPYHDLMNYVVGIVTLGTPFGGASAAKVARLRTHFARWLGSSSSSKLLEILEKRNPGINELKTSFCQVTQHRKIHVQYYYETQETNLLRNVFPKGIAEFWAWRGWFLEKIVEAEDASAGSGHLALPLIARHAMLNKYRGPIDESYKTVSSCLKKFADSAHTDLARKKSLGSGLKPAWNVPFSRNVRFVGRDAQLHQLKNFLFARDQPGKIAIWGLGGIGKTQIALQLAYHTRDKYSDCSVLWMSAISAEGLEQAFVEVGQQLKVPGIEEKQANAKRLVKDYLGNARAGRWLLIVDNIDDMDIWKYVLKDYLPESPQGCVVCTSRSKKVVVEISASSVVEVPQMEEEMAMQLLRKLLIDSELLSHEQDARDLLHELTFLPLAIVQASAYINANSNTLSEYVSLIRGQEQDMITVLSQDFGDDQRYEDVKNPVATTWLISFQQIQRTDPLAADYLSLLSCVVSKDIPLSILPLPSEVEPPKVQKSIAIGTLAAYSFVVKRPANDTIDIHRLVQLAARSWLKAENQWHVWVDKTIQRLVEIVPFGGHEKRELWTPYLPHAIQTTGLSENGAVEGWMFLMERIGHCERLLGHYRTAEGIHSQLLRRKQKALGEEHPSTLASMHEMGVALGDQGKYSEAEKMHQETLALKETALGKEHPETLASMHNLACTLGNQGKYAEAEKMHRETLALTETALGKEHPSTLASMHEVGVALGNQGKYAEAEKMHRETLALKETALGKEHPSTLTSMGNLAQTLGHQRKYAKAEKMHRETLALKETALGKEHPSTLTSMGNLAQTLDHQGKYAKAEKMHRETLALKETALGKEHPETLASMNNLACTLGNQGKYAEAEKMHRETLALTETALGKEHPSTLVSMNNLAWTLGDQGKYTEAEKLNQEIMTLEEGLDNT